MPNTQQQKNKIPFFGPALHWADDFLTLIFPPTCVSCNFLLSTNQQLLCSNCISELPKTNNHLKELPIIKEKFYGRIEPKQIFVYLNFRKKGITQKLFHTFKYRGNKELAEYLGKLFGENISDYIRSEASNSVLVPVPLHPQKLKLRGYNQAEEICKGLSKVLSISIEANALKRIQSGVSQTKSNRIKRWEQLKEVYQIADNNIHGKHIFLVDDVLTTGATLEICYNELLKAKPASISILCLANVQL